MLLVRIGDEVTCVDDEEGSQGLGGHSRPISTPRNTVKLH